MELSLCARGGIWRVAAMAARGLPLPSDPVRHASLSKDSSSWSAAPSR